MPASTSTSTYSEVKAVHGSVRPWVVALAGLASLAVAMGIGRFAFTPLLPMMLHDGVLNLGDGSWLATSNYLGYLLGALVSMALPWASPRLYAKWHPALLAKLGLAATVLLTAAMALPWPHAWPALRFAAGFASALALLNTAAWCLVRLSAVARPELAGLIFGGPGLGILVTGLMASGMVSLQWHSASGWWMFGGLALVLCAFIWPVIGGRAALYDDNAAAATKAAPQQAAPAMSRAVHAVAYGLSGFGYIITATFLPVIAREVLPGNSGWADLFWPIAGAAAFTGAVLCTRVPVQWSRRGLLLACFVVQAAGIGLGLLLPTTLGFALSSVLVGLPFNAITLFGLQEARRTWPASADAFAGLITALYGIGQIAGPPLVAWLITHLPASTGFERGLEMAALSLVLGAAMYAVSILVWPQQAKVQAK